jgi:rapamycin-insensitive companion of mTOR
MQPAAVVEFDRQTTELMTKLIGVLQRHLRVRYELNLNDLLHAYALYPFLPG